MNILIANSIFNIAEQLESALTETHQKVTVTVVSTVAELVVELKSKRHDVLVTEYTFNAIDVWKIAKLIHSDRMAEYVIPLYAVIDSFLFEVPIALAKAHRLNLIDLNGFVQEWVPSHNPPRPTANRQSKQTLLLIEDDLNAARLLHTFLSTEYLVDRAATGEEGIQLWLKKRHDLVLLDYLLPDTLGEEVLRRILDADRLQPVIMMTGHDRQDLNIDMIMAGAYEYLCKPVSLAGLLAKCRSVLSLALLNYHHQQTETIINTQSSFLLAVEATLRQGTKQQALAYIEMLKNIMPLSASEDDVLAVLTLSKQNNCQVKH